MRNSLFTATFLFLLSPSALVAQEIESGEVERIAAAVKAVEINAESKPEQEQQRSSLGRLLRAQIQAANRASSDAWSKIKTREEWEAFRSDKLAALKKSLNLVSRPAKPTVMTTSELAGDGFKIHNLVFESRPGLVVTANLYAPDPPRNSMPCMLLSHSHHNPKHEGELQDMGMTWARAGCYVLVPDHLGHGERRQHPFASAADFEKPFAAGRQDYYFRYDTSLQLYLAGESLMGWMVHDLMTGVDVLLAQPGADAKRIILLGAVAGGGDPAGVTAAVDERITCVAPFNFGGPQPESRYPLPDDAETSFNYAGGGSWESTRNLWRSAADGFLPWTIIGSVAPRHLIHAHEFSWDRERDPVWKRYQKIWKLHDVPDRLAFAHGHGTLTSKDPPGSHCNNIGAMHRRQIHDALRQWFAIDVKPQDEYRNRKSREELTCLTAEARKEFHPQPLYKILSASTQKELIAARDARSQLSTEERKQDMRRSLAKLLGDIEPAGEVVIRDLSPDVERKDGLTIRREGVEVEPGLALPLVTLSSGSPSKTKKHGLLLVISSSGINDMLKAEPNRIAAEIAAENIVALAEVRGIGATSPGRDRGQSGAAASHSATHLMLGQPMLGAQLRELRAVWRHVTGSENVDAKRLRIWGYSSAKALPAGAPVAYPRRIDSRPPECEPTGPALALLLALFEDGVTGVQTTGGLVSYASILESPFVQVPHECIVPGILHAADLPDVVAALAPRPVLLERTVDGSNRLVSLGGR